MPTATHPAPHPLRALVLPVYLPSFVYAAGAAALLPVQVLLALELGFSPAEVTAILTWIGAFAIVSSLAAGHLVDRLGDTRAVALTTAVGTAGLVGAAAAAIAGVRGAGWILVAALTAFGLVDAVWSIARQGLVADLASAQVRGRAMNLYGGCQRLGRVAGPAVAAGVLLVTGPAAVLPVAAALVLVATGILLRHRPARHTSSADEAPTSVAANDVMPQADPGRAARRTMVLLGAGVLILSALRTAKETLVPLWAAEGVHLPSEQVALLMAVTSSMELVLLWPSGVALDRWGRTPVVVTAMGLMSLGLCLAPWQATPAWLFAAAMLIGLGDGTGSGIIKTLGVDVAPTHGRARFLGWWQSIASGGSLAAPALSGALIAAGSLGGAMGAVGLLGCLGTAWMAWWTPRLVPCRSDAAASPDPWTAQPDGAHGG
ncbi:MFS transporter [Arsenicicoccus dermatophilus]|uniref:MFS transporter n=1 Tax=Arsenicicoccus dermatophilus TaxID=1076331 RepID=UPI003916D35D